MVFANQEALQQMLSLWNSWQADQKLPHGLGRWKNLFERLRDVRPWGVRDRLLETGVLQDWQERAEQGQEVVPCEIELWFRADAQQRRAARARVDTLVDEQGGRVIAEAVIEEIGYHALLTHLPARALAPLLENPEQDLALIQCEQIQFFQASGQMSVSLPDDTREEDREPLPEETPTGTPIVALLDGMPLQAHRRLQTHLVVDDPDEWERDYPVQFRRHGTAMASLIVHGDLVAGEQALGRPLYVRPILRPDARGWRPDETVPEDTLVVDLIHRSVRRLFEGEGEEPAVAPDIELINLSIGIRDRPFESAMSPLARLLDWLAWRYQVLFIVSAGNHPGRIALSIERSELDTLPAEELQRCVIRSVAGDARHRRLLSPAEAINVLTVAAAHDDASGMGPPPTWIDPLVARKLPSPINAQGMGYRRAIKPELLGPGGRIAVRQLCSSTENATLEVYGNTVHLSKKWR